MSDPIKDFADQFLNSFKDVEKVFVQFSNQMNGMMGEVTKELPKEHKQLLKEFDKAAKNLQPNDMLGLMNLKQKFDQRIKDA